jgi:hypothetical protein
LKRNTKIFLAVGIAAIGTIAAVTYMRNKAAAPNAAKMPVPGPQGKPGWNLNTINDVVKNAGNTADTLATAFGQFKGLFGTGDYSKNSQGDFSGKTVSDLRGDALPDDPNHLWS